MGKRPSTDPTNPDSDGDGLSDGVESNSGTFAGAADTGTSPVSPDTDSDGVDDKTEVTASIAGLKKANPLKADTRPVEVFILLGQSNMVGAGNIGPAGKAGSLEHAVKQESKYPYLVNPAGSWGTFWSVRDVFIMTSGNGPGNIQHNQPMSIKGVERIGPEFGIAEQVRHVAPAPVMI